MKTEEVNIDDSLKLWKLQSACSWLLEAILAKGLQTLNSAKWEKIVFKYFPMSLSIFCEDTLNN